jgi:hypothetical protein
MTKYNKNKDINDTGFMKKRRVVLKSKKGRAAPKTN